jgi:hypothetical protein
LPWPSPPDWLPPCLFHPYIITDGRACIGWCPSQAKVGVHITCICAQLWSTWTITGSIQQLKLSVTLSGCTANVWMRWGGGWAPMLRRIDGN